MEGGISQNNLQHITQFWSMLDEMAESDPEAYKKFMQRQLSNAKDQCVPPEPHLSLRTKILIPKEKDLYINICEWNMVPAPESDAHPVPVSAGRLEEISKGSDLYMVIDVAYNSTMLKMADKEQTEMDQLIRLAMKYIEANHRVTLCHSYHIADFKLKGSMKRMRDRLRGFQSKPTVVQDKRSNDKEASLLEQIKNISVNGEVKDELSSPIRLINDDHARHPKHCLIEEISSSEVATCTLPSPDYELSVLEGDNETSRKLELKVELPGLSSVSECDLSISQEDVLLDAPGKYRLLLDLPHAINKDAATAQFHKQNHTLLVTMPIL
ncbi:PIH1 domain-containing protein 2 [Ambystoma mexicanum]|uniref:PIH1 domain-containing protein 2 n=1 Tax=Ambystoma mexicanum TaxID=8296 RepID=UPI0037E8EF76